MPSMSTDLRYRTLAADELARVAEIDRSERIDAVYVQHGTQLELVIGDWNAPPWDVEGDGEHSVAMLRRLLEDWVRRGATMHGSFAGERLVGLGGVLPHLRSGAAQLIFLYVSNGFRGRGIGGRLSAELDEIARAAGDTSMVVSATPSLNTVRFYIGQGYAPMEEPLPELFALEPEDIHLEKLL
jgi:GNAT superfamily N-acetyltransferase